jgi:hypothetical protein
MKKTLLSILMFVSINSFGQQQPTNGNFESWNTESYGVEPSQWLDGNGFYGTLNYLVSWGEGDPLTTLKITGANAAGGIGSSVLLETKASVGQTLINQGYPIIQGLLTREEPFTGSIPSSISVDVKPQILAGDTGYVYIEFRDASGNALKYAYQEWYNSSNNWQNLTIPVIDFAPGVVSNVLIDCVSSYSGNGSFVVGSKLYLDNFNFNYPCQIDNEVYLTNMAFYSSTNAMTQMGATGYDLPSTLTPNTNNINNFLDIGKPIRFKIKCKNTKQNGQSIVSGQCKIRTTDPNIQLVDSLSGLNNVGWNSDGWSTDEFEIIVSNTVTSSYTAYVDFIVIENGIEYVTPCVPIPVKPFTVSTFSIDDDNNPDSQGDGDQIPEPNETIEVLPLINNTSEFDASLVKGYFLNLDNYSGINIWNNVPGASGNVSNNSVWNYSFGQPQPIPAGTINSSPQFDFVFDYNLSTVYSFDLYLATHGGFYLFGTNNGKTLIRTTNKLSLNQGNPTAPISGANLVDQESNTISIHPNPAFQELNVTSEHKVKNAYLVDLNGKKQALIENNNQISLYDVEDGLYFLTVILKNGEIKTEKITIKH